MSFKHASTKKKLKHTWSGTGGKWAGQEAVNEKVDHRYTPSIVLAQDVSCFTY